MRIRIPDGICFGPGGNGFPLITIAAILSLLCHWDFFSFRRRVGSKLGVFFLSLTFFFFCYLPFHTNDLGAFLFLEEPPQPSSCSHIGHDPTYPLRSCYSFLSWFVPLEPYLFLPLSFVAFCCLSLLFVAFRSWASHSHARRARLAPPLDCNEREGKGEGAKS